MSRTSLMLIVVAFCFAAGYAGDALSARAAVGPAPCVKYQCKNTHAYWDANDATVVKAYVRLTDLSKEVNNQTEIFTPDSDRKLPPTGSGKKIRVIEYLACSPHCGKDATGKWQSPQTVSPVGPEDLTLAAEIDQLLCADAGGIGPQSANQANDNPKDRSPPEEKK